MMSKDEVPSPYDAMVERGDAEVNRNGRGEVVVSQGTQFQDMQTLKEKLLQNGMKIGLLVCGITAIAALTRISMGTIPCTVVNEEPCLAPGAYISRLVNRFFGMCGR